jgi:hypothetical protein
MKLKTLLYLTPLIFGVGYLNINFQQKRLTEAKEKFYTLLDLADINRDGTLSDLEKDLLAARLNTQTFREPVREWNRDNLLIENLYSEDLNSINRAMTDYTENFQTSPDTR